VTTEWRFGTRGRHSPGAAPDVLRGCDRPLAEAYEGALLDLDGVLYLGNDPVPHASESVEAARRLGLRLAFVTNNASGPPDAVATKLRAVGVVVEAAEVVTSAQAAATLLADRFPRGAAVLVVGGDGLRTAVSDHGFRLVDNADDRPVAVAQGYSPDLTYAQLAEAALAVRRGAVWIASNPDPTLPSPRGLLPGNGSLVALVATATGRSPEFAGKPHSALIREASRRIAVERPLVIGDRLNTDMLGANRCGCDSLAVLTGVTGLPELLAAAPDEQPTFLGADLRALLQPHPSVGVDGSAASCGGWRAQRDGGEIRIDGGGGDPFDAVRAACAVAWTRPADEAAPERIDGLAWHP
jgi:glycerol 3-phosphatase-2